MAVTPMHDDYSIDEEALRAHLRRLVAAGNGIYLGSGGSGEGHALTPEELRLVYDIGVDEAKGKVPVYANPREARTADAMHAVCAQAVEAGVDMVQVYQLDAGHGMTPTVREQEAYFNSVIGRLDHPVALSIHVFAGYLAPVSLLSTLCDRFPQILAINVMGPPERYFLQVRDTLPEAVRLFTGVANLPGLVPLGAVGGLGAENNCIPNVCRSIGDAIVDGDADRLAFATQTLRRFSAAVAEASPNGGSSRGNKMAMKALGLGNGVLRPPYLALPEADQAKLAALLDGLGIREAEGL
jgi:4-hydroxy-tetrahydrodipicolinate synthase